VGKRPAAQELRGHRQPLPRSLGRIAAAPAEPDLSKRPVPRLEEALCAQHHARPLADAQKDATSPRNQPPLEFPRAPGPKARENTALPDQLAALRAAAPPWLRLFILLCWQTALRFSEAIAVTPRSFNPERNTATIRTKGDKVRTIPLTEEILELIRPTLEGDPDKSCVALLKGTRCSPGAIRSAWCQLCKRLKIENVNPHDLRRTTATRLYWKTKDIRLVQQYLGHDSMTSTLRYLAPLKEEELREYHKLLAFHSEVKQ
jgi:integrase